MKEKKYKIGQRVLFKTSGQYVTGNIVANKKGLFGQGYLIEYTVDSDIFGRYKTIGFVYSRRIQGTY